MNTDERIDTYLAQTGRKALTPRQRRRVLKKDPNATVPESGKKASSK